MKGIHLVALEAAGAAPALAGEAPAEALPVLLADLAGVLARVFRVNCTVRGDGLDAGFAFDPARNQYHSTALLERLAALDAPPGLHRLGVTTLDLYVPVLTFVFGEAQLRGLCAVVSLHRLREEFYGLPPNLDLLRERLAKEAVHELGHTLGLRHCPDWQCVMASTHAVERLDLKATDFCPACRRQAGLWPAPAALAEMRAL